MLLLLASLAAVTGAPQRTAPAMLGAVPPDADLLFVQPAPGLGPAGLAEGLRALGIEALDGRAEGARVRVPAGADPAAVAARIAGSGLARTVEADGLVRAAQTPSGPLTARTQAAYLDAAGVPDAWRLLAEEDVALQTVVVAIIDSGIDGTHPDLAERLVVNEREAVQNGRDDDGNGCIDDVSGCSFVSPLTADPSCGYTAIAPHRRATDDEGHGTFVAGILAAAGGTGQGIVGVAQNARLLPVKVLDCTATGRISDAAAGIRYAARSGAHVINVSFGTLTDSPALREAVREAQAAGAVIVASAGNDGRSGVTYPARYEGVISVAASGLVQANGSVDYRATAEFARFPGGVDLLAPGVQVVGTLPPSACGERGWVCLDEDEPYGIASGSSFATPFVSAAVAVTIGRHPERSGIFAAQLVLGARARGATREDAPVLDVAGALRTPLHALGVPGTSRFSGQGPLVIPDDR